MDVKFRMTEFYFNSEKVIAYFGRDGSQTRIALRRATSYIKGRIRRLLRPRQKFAKPGQAPSVHTTNPIYNLKNVENYFDTTTRSAVVGSVFVKNNRWGRALPSLMEIGGDVQGGGKVAHYATHPFTQPAMEQFLAKGKIPAAFDPRLKV